MDYKDYYKIMGLSRDATQDDIKRAYRKLARKYHPDVSKETDAEARFKDLGEAYEALKDPEKRAAYDRLGSEWEAGQEFRPPPDWDANFEFSGGGFTRGGEEAFSDFFETLFGHAAAHTGARGGFRGRGQDHHAKILIDLEDAFEGSVRTITLNTPELSKEGRVRTHERTLKVRIPKGIQLGQQIRLGGQGTPGIGGGVTGDLYLKVEFKPHPLYRIDSRDLTLDLPVAPWEAALGATVKVPTPGGTVDLKIPAGSSGGRKLRLKGRGIPGKSVGDLYVILQVSLPPATSDKAKALYSEMERELAFNPRAKLGV